MEDKIENFEELETALANLQNLSQEINTTFNESASIYETQGEAWYSANSAREATKIGKNVSEVSDTINKFKTTSRNIDES